jgi:hypothetical protein
MVIILGKFYDGVTGRNTVIVLAASIVSFVQTL